jgi:hypothetical protein
MFPKFGYIDKAHHPRKKTTDQMEGVASAPLADPIFAKGEYGKAARMVQGMGKSL